MSDIIRVNTDNLSSLSKSMKSLANKLNDTAEDLSGLNMNLTTSLHQVRSGSCRLSGWANVASISTGTTSSVTRRYRKALEAYAQKVGHLSQLLERVSSMYQELEDQLSQVTAGELEDNEVKMPNGFTQEEQEIRAEQLRMIIYMLDHAFPPKELASYTTARKLQDDGFYQFAEGAYSFLTGDYQNMAQTDAGKSAYLFDNLLSGCLANDVELVTADTLLDVLQGVGIGFDITSIVAELMKAQKVGDAMGIAGYVNSLSADAIDNLVSEINQVIILQNLDQDAARGMANAYLESDDPVMRDVGKSMNKLLDMGPVGQFAYIDARTAGAMGVDIVEDTVFAGLNYALGKIPGVGIITAPGSITSAGMDFAVNAGDYAGLTNNLIYAADAVDATYNSFQADYKAYQENPTDANLTKAVESYKAYQRSAANSMEAFGEYSKAATDSAIGKRTSSEKAKNVDEQAEFIADMLRNTTNDVDLHHTHYDHPDQYNDYIDQLTAQLS